jgi:hypothetical protein
MRVDERIDKIPQTDDPSENERRQLITPPEFTIDDEEVMIHKELNRTSQTRDQSDIQVDCRYVVHETMNEELYRQSKTQDNNDNVDPPHSTSGFEEEDAVLGSIPKVAKRKLEEVRNFNKD